MWNHNVLRIFGSFLKKQQKKTTHHDFQNAPRENHDDLDALSKSYQGLKAKWTYTTNLKEILH